MSKINVKINKCDAQFKLQICQRKRRGQNRHNYIQNAYQIRNRSEVETEIHHIEVEEDSVRITHKITKGDPKTILGMTIEEIIIENKSIGIGVEVETITEILIEIVLRHDYS